VKDKESLTRISFFTKKLCWCCYRKLPRACRNYSLPKFIVREKVCNKANKRKKSRFFNFEKKR